MNVLIFTAIRDDYKGYLGIIKKIMYQVSAWERLGHKAFYCFEDATTLKMYSSDGIIVEKLEKSSKIIFRKDKYRILPEWVKGHSIDILYVRYDTLDFVASKSFAECKTVGAKVLVEFPTYPYKGEVKNANRRMLDNKQYLQFVIKRLFQLSERIASKKASSCIDYFVTFMYEGTIWGVPVICIDNGVDVSSIPVRIKKKQDMLTFICVANYAKWHGIDRLIDGIAQDPNRDYQVWLVGEGSELQTLKDKVHENGLENIVHFYGAKTGDDLTELTNCADIGIGSLGLHRIGLTWGSTLKAKEYCAASLPFIYSYDEKKLTGKEPFAIKLPADDSPIDMPQVTKWANELIDNHAIAESMRNFAEENYDWTVIIKELIDKIQQG